MSPPKRRHLLHKKKLTNQHLFGMLLAGKAGIFMLNRFGAFVTGITACYKYIQRIKTQEMSELGLKGTHMTCLFFLNQNPDGMTAAQLCHLCDEDKAAISRALAELETKGYLRTQPMSGKKYRAVVQLTEAGFQVAQQMDGLIEDWVTVGGAGLTDEERADFYRVLEKIAVNLKKHYEKN